MKSLKSTCKIFNSKKLSVESIITCLNKKNFRLGTKHKCTSLEQ